MPCNGGPWNSYRDDSSDRAYIKELQAKIDFLTNHLCKMCRHAEHQNVPNLYGDLLDWWEGHKQWDIQREEKEKKERLAEAALKALTDEQESALKWLWSNEK